jgi:crotonobetainyl-CoA:carnitine CoA-transferase CaiB-like acyl-CoA transferase
MGYARLLAEHRAPYETSDGYLCLLAYNDKQWRNFFAMIGSAETFDTDPRFSTPTARSQHIAEIYAFVADHMRARTTAEWLDALTAADIPAMPLNTLEVLLHDPHLNETGFFSVVTHPTEGPMRSMAVPSTWSESQPGTPSPAPRLGEHSVEVLREAGYSAAEIEKLLAARVTSTV